MENSVRQVIQYVLDTHCGLSPQLSQQTIHDAFRSLHAADIAAIYRRQLTPTEQSALLCQAEMFHRNRVECFMRWMGILKTTHAGQSTNI